MADPPDAQPGRLLFRNYLTTPYAAEIALRDKEAYLTLLRTAKLAEIDAAEARTTLRAAKRRERLRAEVPVGGAATAVRAKLELAPLLATDGQVLFSQDSEGYVNLPALTVPRAPAKAPFRRRLPRDTVEREVDVRTYEGGQREVFREALDLELKEVSALEHQAARPDRRRCMTAQDDAEARRWEQDSDMRAPNRPSSAPSTPSPQKPTAPERRAALAKRMDIITDRKPWTELLEAPVIEDDAFAVPEELAHSIQRTDKEVSIIKEIITGQSQSQFIVKDDDIKAKMFFMGATKAWDFLEGVFLSLVHASFDRWRSQAEAEKAAYLAREYRRFQGSRKLAFAWLDGLLRTLARGWIAWCALVGRLKIIERVTWQTACALKLQHLWRSFLGRRLVEVMRLKIQLERERKAAEGLQAMWRRRAAWKKFQIVVYEYRRECASIIIQGAWRCFVARCLYAHLQEQKRRYDAALMIQCRIRQRQARQEADRRRLALEKEKASRLIQRVARGRRGRQKAAELREERRVAGIVKKLQRRIRMVIGCARFITLRAIAEAYHKEMVFRATRMQAIYRGKRARMMTRIKLHNLRQKKQRLMRNHQQCQRICRGFSARRSTKKLRIETRKRRVTAAKMWKMIIENPDIPQDQQRVVYTSLETGETVEEEPLEGFADFDRNLHLEKVYGVSELVENPLLRLSSTDLSALAESKRCSECEDYDASRLCDHCGDQFCAACWPVVHDAGRQHHTYVTVNMPECAQCMAQFAVRYCKQCDEEFCEECYDGLHVGPVLRTHKWTLTEEGAIDYGIVQSLAPIKSLPYFRKDGVFYDSDDEALAENSKSYSIPT